MLIDFWVILAPHLSTLKSDNIDARTLTSNKKSRHFKRVKSRDSTHNSRI